jgi:hypothetical protein
MTSQHDGPRRSKNKRATSASAVCSGGLFTPEHQNRRSKYQDECSDDEEDLFPAFLHTHPLAMSATTSSDFDVVT